MNSRKKKPGDPIDEVLANQFLDRIAELERRIVQLEEDVARLKSVSPSPLLDTVVIEVERRKRGRKEAILDAVLFSYRDGLTLWLESVWPWLKDRLFTAKTPEEVKVLLEAIAEEPDSRPECQERLLRNVDELFKFIQHEKFRKKELRTATVVEALTLPWNDEKRGHAANRFPTRQIANAMAGVPEISWSRSLDRCYVNPSTVCFSLTTEMYYRQICGMPMPEERYLMDQRSPVPKPLRAISAQPSVGPAEASNAQVRTAEAANENTATGPVRAR